MLIPELQLLFSAILTFPEQRQNEIGQIILDAIGQGTLPVIEFSDDERTVIDAAIQN